MGGGGVGGPLRMSFLVEDSVSGGILWHILAPQAFLLGLLRVSRWHWGGLASGRGAALEFQRLLGVRHVLVRGLISLAGFCKPECREADRSILPSSNSRF